MTAKELHEQLGRYLEANPDYADWRIVVPIATTGIGRIPCADITSASCGFDWDHGLIILTPEVPLIWKHKKK